MSTPINLNKARKARDKADAKARADANAVKFGRTKAERIAEAAREDRAKRLLDGHQRDDD